MRSVYLLLTVAAVALGQEPAAVAPRETPVLGAPADFDLSAAEEHLEVAAGTPLFRRPSRSALVLRHLDAPALLPIVERRGAWVRVRDGSWKGWVALPGAPPSAAAPGVDPQRLAAARAGLGPSAGRPCGPFTLYTDVGDEKLVGHLARLAENLPRVYEERVGVRPLVGDGAAVVLFAHADRYEAYLAGDASGAGVPSRGHAGGGLAVLHAAAQGAVLRRELVHQLTHLLTDAALGPELEPWLAEGLAADLAYCRVDPRGRLLLATLDGENRRRDPLAAPDPIALPAAVLRSWERPERPRLAGLVALSRPELLDPERREVLVALSAFLVRYLHADHLTDLPDRSRGHRFRQFLQAVAEGDRATSSDLLRWLELSWDELERGLPRWLQRVAYGLRADLTLRSRRIEVQLYHHRRDLFSLEVDLALYDLTSTCFKGHGPERG